MWRLWCVLLIAVGLGCGAASARHGHLHRTVVELADPVLMQGGYIIIEQRQEPSWSVAGAMSSLGKQIKDGVSQAFWSGLRFWDRVWRHEQEMVTRATGSLFGRNQLLKGSPGATEPMGVIPEPPTMHYKSHIRSRLYHAVAATLSEYAQVHVVLPHGSSCADVLDRNVAAMKALLAKNLEAFVCAKPGGRCSQKFCHRLAKERNAVINRVLAMSFIDPVHLALTRLGRCREDPRLQEALFQTIDLRDRFTSQVHPSQVKPLLDNLCGGDPLPAHACRLRDEHPALFETILLHRAPVTVHFFVVRHGPLRRAPAAAAAIGSGRVKNVPADSATHAAPVLRAVA